MTRAITAAALAAASFAFAASAAARPADVVVTNAAAAPIPVYAPSPLLVQPVPSYYRSNGVVSAGSASGACTASLFDGIPAGDSFVLTNALVDAQDTVRPDIVVWLRQQTGGGFFTHFAGVPLSQFPTQPLYAGTLALNELVTPGATAAGSVSNVFVCVTPGAGDSSASAHYSLSGYLVPAGAGQGAGASSVQSKSQPAATG